MNTMKLDAVTERLPKDVEELIESNDLTQYGLILIGCDTTVVNFNRYTQSMGFKLY